MKRFKKYGLAIFKYILAFVLIFGSIKIFLKPEDLKLLAEITTLEYGILILVTLLIYLISGVGYALAVKANTGVKLRLSDVLLFPISMNLWSFIIPFQGALLYSTLILKYKYKTAFSGALSTTLFTYLLAVCMTGLISILFLVMDRNYFSILMLVSIGLFLSPIIFILTYRTISKFIKRFGFFDKLGRFILTIVDDISKLFKNRTAVIRLVSIDFLNLAASVLLNILIVRFLGLDLSLSFIILFTLFIRLSVILKITPGNIGVQELLSGGIFSAFALDPAQGVLITLTSRITSLLLMCTLGVVDTIWNMKYLKLRKKSGLSIKE